MDEEPVAVCGGVRLSFLSVPVALSYQEAIHEPGVGIGGAISMPACVRANERTSGQAGDGIRSCFRPGSEPDGDEGRGGEGAGAREVYCRARKGRVVDPDPGFAAVRITAARLQAFCQAQAAE